MKPDKSDKEAHELDQKLEEIQKLDGLDSLCEDCREKLKKICTELYHLCKKAGLSDTVTDIVVDNTAEMLGIEIAYGLVCHVDYQVK